MAITPLKGNSPPNVNTVLQSNPGDRVAADKGAIAPIVAVLSRQLPLPQAQQLAGQTAMVKVAKSGPGNEAQLEVEGQLISVKMPPGKQLAAGDMITVSFALQEKGDSSEAGGAKQTKKTQDISQLLGNTEEGGEEGGEQTSKSFVDKLSSSARLLGLIDRLTTSPAQPGKLNAITTQLKSMPAIMAQVADDIPMDLADAAEFVQGIPGKTQAQAQAQAQVQPQAGVQIPAQAPKDAKQPGQAQANQATQGTQSAQATTMADKATSSQIARHVSNAVEKSGLFYESHLQQWANGERSKTQLLQEPQSRFGQEQVISEKQMDPAAFQQSVKLVGQQLATLDQSRMAINLQGLFPNPVELEISADADSEADQNAAPQLEGQRPWLAKLKLDMPTLGELRVQLRLVGNTLDLQIAASKDSKGKMDPYWRDFQHALETSGLHLVHGQIRTTDEPQEPSA